MKKTLIACNIILVVATACSYLSSYIDPSDLWLFSFFGLAFPFLLLLNIVFVFIWTILRKKYVFLSIACLLLGVSFIPSFVGLRSPAPIEKNKEHIRVMSFNMRYLLSIWDNNKKAMSTNLDEFTEFINSYGPVDILIAPETNKVKDIKNRLGLEHSFIVRKINFAIISKYPILDAGYLETGVSDRAGGWADLDVNGKTVRLYGLYLQTNKITVETNDIVKEADLKQKKFWQNIQTIISRYRKSAPQRVAQAKLVKEHAADCTHPILICGDFNDTPNSHIYHLLSKDMQDAFKVKGSGIGTTFTGNIPTLRIDFILANDDFAVKNFHTIENKFSDHKLIFADLEILL